MAHSTRRRGIKEYRNRRKKAEYASKAEEDRRSGLRKAFGSGKHVRNGDKKVGTSKHARPCGNSYACRECYPDNLTPFMKQKVEAKKKMLAARRSKGLSKALKHREILKRETNPMPVAFIPPIPIDLI